MELSCPNVKAYSQWLQSLKPEEAAQLSMNCDGQEYKRILNENGIDLEHCDRLELLRLIRDKWSSLSDDDLEKVVGGEKFVAKIATAIAVPVVVGGVAGAVVGGAVGGAASLGYLGGTHQIG